MRSTLGMALLLCVALIGSAHAGEPSAPASRTPTKQEQAEAGKKFKEGERAFAKHDYKTAAEAFEAAYAIAPHPDVLLNAVDARDRAGDLVIAARHCARLIKDFPEHKSVAEARAHLAQLTPKIGRIDLVVKGVAKDLTLDGAPIEPGEGFVDPGDHLVVASFGGERAEKSFAVAAGVRASVVIEPPPKEKDGDKPQPLGPTGPAPKENPFHPAIFGTAAGLTVAAGAVLIWSGLDTNAARAEFDKNPTQAGLEDGQNRQLRTNILIGVTAGLAAITVPIAVFTEWGGGAEASPSAPTRPAAWLRAGPGGFALEGRY